MLCIDRIERDRRLFARGDVWAMNIRWVDDVMCDVYRLKRQILLLTWDFVSGILRKNVVTTPKNETLDTRLRFHVLCTTMRRTVDILDRS